MIKALYSVWKQGRNTYNFAIETCNIAQATHMRSYGERERGHMHHVCAIYIDLSNFKWYVCLLSSKGHF